ncbi:MAG: DUF3857 domain-containing protein [Verrucomicrobiota bacterium]|jgi:hypothetical protein
MLADSTVPQPGNALGAAAEQVHLGPLPAWVVPCSFRSDFKPKQPGHVTFLLSSKQLHAEQHQEFVHAAIRLESIEAVQSQSQWRLEFDPRRQRVILHWIKTHRGVDQFDHTKLEQIRTAQADSGASAHNGRVTLSLMLEDVRPGDIVEWCYTIDTNPLLLPDQCACLFPLPAGAALGRLFFSVRFGDGRQMQWKSSAPDLAPVETRDNVEIKWVWARENLPGLRPEENTPDWHIAYPWIQVSDCPDWQTVAAAFAELWPEDPADAGVEAMAREIAAAQPGILAQTEKAIQLVQDEYRCLATDGELDGSAPAAPAVVARRRFGDCKDLSFLLVHLLKRLGTGARLILVNSDLRKSLADLLPMPSLFNHVVVEYQVRGETRWVDVTMKRQGGGSLNRVIRDYGVGLPVARSSAHLLEPPAGAAPASVYEIKETVLLDTSGTTSLLAVVVSARGSHAEEMRREFESLGGEAIARRRSQFYNDRFGHAERMEALAYRDDRAANEFLLAETYEIKDFLKADAKSGWYKLEIVDDFIANLLTMPDSGARRAPFALPHPCNVVHIFEVYCVALPPAIVQERVIETPWLRFTRQRTTLVGSWTVKSTLSTLADAVPAERIDEHRESVREIRAQSTWALLAPAGQERPHRRVDFGVLPVSWETPDAPSRTVPVEPPVARRAAATARVSAPLPASAPKAAAGATNVAAGAPAAGQVEVHRKRRKRHRRRHREDKKLIIWQAILGGLLVLVLILLFMTLTRATNSYNSKLEPPAVNLPVNK